LKIEYIKSYDFRIQKTNIIIEVNGDFWHANPNKYKENDIVKHTKDGILAKDIWKKDEEKLLLAKKNGYRVVYIWETEFNNLTDVELTNLLYTKIK